MTFTTLDVDFAEPVLEQTRRIMFGVDYDRDGRLVEDEYRAIADRHWPDRRRPSWDAENDFA